MNGIDTAVASLLASRIDSLLSVSARADATASQTGAAEVGTKPSGGVPLPSTPPLPASAQTALSAIALTLDAITRWGGEATPALLGEIPVWAAAPAIEIAALPLFDASTGAEQAAGNAATPQGTGNANSANAAASVVATSLPVAELAAALKQTVAASGLFYESHLAQWLSGQRPVGSLADEPQNRLADAASQLPLNLGADADADDASSWSQGRSTGGANPNAAMPGNPAARGGPDAPHAQSARFTTFDMATHDIFDSTDDPLHAPSHVATGNPGGASATDASQQQMAATLHPATIPLVRQQLDLLATGQFRWTGEAWPGARLDWTIEQDGDEWRRSGNGAASADSEYPWRTRLTLSLPTLGTVDAELTLTGTRLIARVQASPGGAARLASQGEGFKRRLAEAGIELSGLSIREIGGGMPLGGSAAAAAAAAASVYARSASDDAAAVAAAQAKQGAHDWDVQ